MKLKILSLLTFLLSGIGAFANHLASGEINYKHVNGNEYTIQVKLIGDCSLLNFPVSIDIEAVSNNCTQQSVYSLPLIGATDVSQVCPNFQSTCNSGPYPGFEEWVYEGNIVLPQQCTDWVISYAFCCRNGVASNIVNVGDFDFYVDATLDNLNYPANSSPVFNPMYNFVLAFGNFTNINFSAFDPDGDSLSFHLVPAHADTQTPLTYVQPFTHAFPMGSATPVALNPYTGILEVTPNSLQASVVAVEVREYRNGVMIGTARKDVQLMVNSINNHLPYTTGINGSGSFSASVCVGDTLNFTIPTFDQNAANALSFNANYAFSNLIYSSDNAQQPTATFIFTPDASMIRPQPYLLQLEIKDNACPIFGTQSYVISLFVNNCAMVDVWPGDANNDYQVNLDDIFPIGVGYGVTGPARAGNTAWAAQTATDWMNVFASGSNFKHADCDGSGTIDSFDLAVVLQNFSFSHQKSEQAGSGNSNDPKIFLSSNKDTAMAGQPAVFQVNLGENTLPTGSTYGVVFTLSYDTNLVMTGSVNVDFSNSWLGTKGAEVITIVKDEPEYGKIHVGMVRMTKTNASGFGPVCAINTVMQDDITGKEYITLPLALHFDYVKVIRFDEAVIPVYADNRNFYVQAEVSSVPYAEAVRSLKIYPNPAKEKLMIELENWSSVRSLELKDMTGNRVFKGKPKAENGIVSIPTQNLNAGVYFLEIIVNGEKLTRKVVLTGGY